MNIKKSNTRIYLNIQGSMKLNPLHDIIFIHNRHFLLFERADLTVSAALQHIRGEIPQLHELRLASTASLTRELSMLLQYAARAISFGQGFD